MRVVMRCDAMGLGEARRMERLRRISDAEPEQQHDGGPKSRVRAEAAIYCAAAASNACARPPFPLTIPGLFSPYLIASAPTPMSREPTKILAHMLRPPPHPSPSRTTPDHACSRRCPSQGCGRQPRLASSRQEIKALQQPVLDACKQVRPRQSRALGQKWHQAPRRRRQRHQAH